MVLICKKNLVSIDMNILFHSMQLALFKKINKYALSKAVYERMVEAATMI